MFLYLNIWWTFFISLLVTQSVAITLPCAIISFEQCNTFPEDVKLEESDKLLSYIHISIRIWFGSWSLNLKKLNCICKSSAGTLGIFLIVTLKIIFFIAWFLTFQLESWCKILIQRDYCPCHSFVFEIVTCLKASEYYASAVCRRQAPLEMFWDNFCNRLKYCLLFN